MWGRAVPYQAFRSHAERRRGSQATYLAAEMTDAVLNYLDERGRPRRPRP